MTRFSAGDDPIPATVLGTRSKLLGALGLLIRSVGVAFICRARANVLAAAARPSACRDVTTAVAAARARKLEAWIYERRTTAKAFANDVFINQERKLGARRRSDTVLVSTTNDADQGLADVAFRTPPAPYEKSKFLGSGGSMVARLKLKGIDGRAPLGVEPAA